MLRLWPKQFFVSIFERSIYVNGIRVQANGGAALTTINDANWGEVISSALELTNNIIRSGDRIVLTISDSAAKLALLPWQKAIRSNNELNVYGEICLNDHLIPNKSDWVIQTIRPRYGSPGLAYALQRARLQDLVNYFERKKIRVVTIAPLSVRALGWLSRKKNLLLYLVEDQRISLMGSSQQHILHWDTESIGESKKMSERRLRGRLPTYFNSPKLRTVYSCINESDIQTIDRQSDTFSALKIETLLKYA